MRVGLLTLHASTNYGAFLQAYALSETIQKMGNDVTFINYLHKYRQNTVAFSFPKYNSEQSILQNAMKILYRLASQALNYHQLSRFLKYLNESRLQNINVTKTTYHSFSDLKEAKETFDIYIAGSDQIWGFQLFGGEFDPVFFLSYLPKTAKTYTYAASMGRVAPPKELVDSFKEYSKNLNIISVRECSVLPFVRENSGKEVYCVLDPTLLLTTEEWSGFEKVPPKKHGRYLLSFSLRGDETYFKKVKKIARKSALEVVWIHNTGVFCKYFVKHNYVRPEEFVWYFANAEAVITDSFHGTMFSIINRKPFYSVAPYPQSVRIEDHLKRLGLLDRLYDSAEKLPDTVTEIDYTKPCEKLEEWRQKSFAYLDMITKPDDEQ